jgi:hypothetical protein
MAADVLVHFLLACRHGSANRCEQQLRAALMSADHQCKRWLLGQHSSKPMPLVSSCKSSCIADDRASPGVPAKGCQVWRVMAICVGFRCSHGFRQTLYIIKQQQICSCTRVLLYLVACMCGLQERDERLKQQLVLGKVWGHPAAAEVAVTA